jgi:hypothetical protein
MPATSRPTSRNVAEYVVVLTGRGVFCGHEGVREVARQLMSEIPSGRIRMQTIHHTVEDEGGRVLIRPDRTRTTPG